MDLQALAATFAKPAAAYRPMLFWIWNGEITREGIREQIAEFAARGAGGFFFHPMGEHFRLQDFVQGMNPPYLSDEYFALVRYAVECARANGLYAWLYDEGGWPSGTAQGKVVEGHPELRGKRLHVHRVQAGDTVPENIVAALSIPEMGIPQPLDLRDVAQGMWPQSEALVFTIQPDGFPVDILSHAAVRRFIEVTHERYAEVVGEFFGNTIPGMFTDETSLGGQAGGPAIPWTRGLLEALTERMGRDGRLYLPLIFAPEAVGRDVFNRYSEHEMVAARCDYYEVLTRQFSGAYWRQITDWCAEHNLIHTGHVGGEDNLPDHVSFGHFFRTAGALHAPGVDVIWRQLFPGHDNFPFPRLATSALKHQPQAFRTPSASVWSNLAITETNAVYGFGLQYEQMRWMADYQFQGGLNLYAPMATHYTCEGGRLYCTMSHFGPGNPLWPAYHAFADYIGRLCALTRHTVEPSPIAVYYPVEALWTRDGTQESWESLRETCLTLLNLQIGFDFLDGDFLPTLKPDNLQAVSGDVAYKLIIVPACLALSAATLSKLADLAADGVPVIFLEHWPLQPAEMSGLHLFERALQSLQSMGLAPLNGGALEERLAGSHLVDQWLRIADPEPALLLSARNLSGEAGPARVYLLTNDSDQVLEPYLTIRAPEPMVLEAWDPRDGEIVSLLAAIPNETAELRPVLAAWSSMILVLRPAAGPLPKIAPEDRHAREFARWLAAPKRRGHRPPHTDLLAEFIQADEVNIVDEYVIREGNVEIITDAEPRRPFVDGAAELMLWQDWGMPEFSGHVEYVFEFTVSPEYQNSPLLLDLGNVFWTASVWLNDQHLGDSLWPPHMLDITEQVQTGTNRLRVIVGNTLANQACEQHVIDEAKEHGWCNPYLQRAIPMMQEDLRSGLTGPVRIVVGTLQPE